MKIKIKIKMRPDGRTVSYEDVERGGGKLLVRLRKDQASLIDSELQRMGIPDTKYFRTRWGKSLFRLKMMSGREHVECIPRENGIDVTPIGFALPPYIFEVF